MSCVQVDEGFDNTNTPYDVIWLDIEHTDNKKYLSWDYSKFPDPVAMQNELAAKGRKLVIIADPHLKRDDGYGIYKEAKNKGYLVKNKDNNDFEGHCWPGTSSYIDTINPEARTYWGDCFQLNAYQGSTEHLFIWNDMNGVCDVCCVKYRTKCI